MSRPNNMIGALLTDLYEITMAYAYFQADKHDQEAAFDLFFRKNPFDGEFTIFAGLREVIRFLDDFSFSREDAEYVENSMPNCTEDFKDWLVNLDASELRVYALKEGTVAFPRVPMIRVEGPLGAAQLVESALLNLTSFPSLVATNAARMKLAGGRDKKLIEFGLRRAQGPDGAMSAARYTYLGGADGTSNTLAGKEYGIPISGTQAHAYISSFNTLDDVRNETLADQEGNEHNLKELTLKYREQLEYTQTNDGELAAFIAYARAFPGGFLALVDTYDTLRSGVPNFLCVALALQEIGYEPIGIRLDSGDLAHLSSVCREMFRTTGERFDVPFEHLTIVASSEINESVLRSLASQGHEIDIYGVGTHLVTCQKDPSLGCVYKLVQIQDQPKIKISQDRMKVTIPGKKKAFRLIGKEGYPLADLMVQPDEDDPEPGQRILCCHPYDSEKRTYITPREVLPLYDLVWDGEDTGKTVALGESRKYVQQQLERTRSDHLRTLNPTPYKVSLSKSYYDYMHELWRSEAPPGEIH